MSHLFFKMLDFKLQDSQQHVGLGGKNQHFSLKKANQGMANKHSQEDVV